MFKTLIVYASKGGETKQIANFIAEGIRLSGHRGIVKEEVDIKIETELNGYDAFIFGSPTYHGEMVQGMKKLLFLSAKANLEDKIGGAFGAFGWSGEATDRIYSTMQTIFKMNMVGYPLDLKSAYLEGSIKMAQEYNRRIINKIIQYSK